ncbi:hypothetical protein MA16_Dca000079 [Dendrobium catenatum]|uniref:Transposase-associated domain-containing protein n=1 Tax=Dendrobium catenatum TaxID=906689 RepID=A0A2I0WSV2_9ASPA|nr:hypothetical protein MA16_Dca000079 [Dendrobium catenatum]
MYNRLSQGRKTLTDEFINGVNFFIQQAKQLPSFISEGKFRCPCSKHKNLVHLEPDDVTVNLYRRGFMHGIGIGLFMVSMSHYLIINAVLLQVVMLLRLKTSVQILRKYEPLFDY